MVDLVLRQVLDEIDRTIMGYLDRLAAERGRQARLVLIQVGVVYLGSQGGEELKSAFARRGFVFCLRLRHHGS